MSDVTEDILSEPPDEPVVHWMEHSPSSYGPAAITGALAGAFLLGVLATVGAMALMRRVVDRDA